MHCYWLQYNIVTKNYAMIIVICACYMIQSREYAWYWCMDSYLCSSSAVYHHLRYYDQMLIWICLGSPMFVSLFHLLASLRISHIAQSYVVKFSCVWGLNFFVICITISTLLAMASGFEFQTQAEVGVLIYSKYLCFVILTIQSMVMNGCN